jgi:two-component system LytT family sensor kinase
MKLRTSEFWVATFAWLFAIYTLLDHAFSASGLHKSYIQEKTAMFAAKGLIFQYEQYHLLPRISVATSLYLAFIFLNHWVIPKYLPDRKSNRIILFVSLAFVFVTSAFATYYRLDNFLSYPSFGVSFVNMVPTVFRIFLVFAVYTIFKYLILNYLAREDKKRTLSGRIMREFVVVFLIWAIALLALMAGNNRNLVPFWVGMVPVGYLLYMLNLYWLIPGYYKSERSLWNYLGKLIAVLLLLFCCASLLLQALGDRPPFPVFLTSALVLYGILILFSWFIYHQNKEQLFQLYSLKTELGRSSADLKFLRSQINPHFLFNVLNTLYGTALQESADRTSEGIQKLGDMMRFMLYENNQDLIPVSREVDYLKDYIHLQNLRLARSENIIVEVNITENACQHAIAPMLLIPFIENAFKHGISLQNRSWIRVSLSCHALTLELDVYNSIHSKSGSDPENGHEGIGLENVRQRLELLYPGRYELVIRPSQIEYFVHLTLHL